MSAEASPDLIESLEALLPQTQCGQCGYDGCTPYAEALAARTASCDRCPPGGDAVAAALAWLLDAPTLRYDRARGEHLPNQVAVVREAECIGCTKCIQACPIDAIVGAAERMHTTMQDACSGCALCVPVCPVDCIDLVLLARSVYVPAADPVQVAHAQRDRHADRWRIRHDARARRLDAHKHQRQARLEAQSALVKRAAIGLPPAVAAAIARAAQRAVGTATGEPAAPTAVEALTERGSSK